MAPLTEHEKRQLRLLEAQLHADDPKFVKTMRTMRSVSFWQRHPKSRQMMIPYLVGLVIGVVALIIGLATSNVVTFASGVVTIAYCIGNPIAVYKQSSRQPKAKTQSAFMANLESRWDERKRNGL